MRLTPVLDMARRDWLFPMLVLGSLSAGAHRVTLRGAGTRSGIFEHSATGPSSPEDLARCSPFTRDQRRPRDPAGRDEPWTPGQPRTDPPGIRSGNAWILAPPRPRPRRDDESPLGPRRRAATSRQYRAGARWWGWSPSTGSRLVRGGDASGVPHQAVPATITTSCAAIPRLGSRPSGVSIAVGARVVCTGR